MSQLLLATRNAHKTREFQALLGPDFEVHDLLELPDVAEVEETGSTFQENALLKALAVSSQLPGLVVSDDSGLEVAALDGAPGVRSARYSGEGASDEMNLRKLLDAMRGYTGAERGAQFRCVLALAADGKVIRTFTGTITGTIVAVPRGESGFGYDSVFQPDGSSLTFAEMDATAKNRLSHRAAAVQQLRDYLRQQSS